MVIENEWYKIWLEGTIINIVYAEGVVVSLKVAESLLLDRELISEGKKHVIQGDTRGVKYWTKEARKFQATAENYRLMIAGTVIHSESHVITTLLNFFLKFNKPPIPVKFCTSLKEGRIWLENFIEEHKPVLQKST